MLLKGLNIGGLLVVSKGFFQNRPPQEASWRIHRE